MTSTADDRLARLAELRTAIADGEVREADLRRAQRDELGEALGAGATVAEVVEASGLSRAYLHRVEVPLYTPQTTHARALRKSGQVDPSEPRKKALATAQGLRDEVEQLRVETEDYRRERNTLIVEAARSDDASRAAIEEAAGVSSEWIRKQVRAAEGRSSR